MPHKKVETKTFTLVELIEFCSPLSMAQQFSILKITKSYWYKRVQDPLTFTVEDIENITNGLRNLANLYHKDIEITRTLVLDCIINQLKVADNPKE